MISAATLILLLVTAQRLSEVVIARRNTIALMQQGGKEIGARHYPAMVALHVGWLAGLWYWGWNAPVQVLPLTAYGVLQIFRFWILATLGRRWTTRIIVLPDETLVTRGPYRFMRHPNYALVAIEVPLLPLVFGLGWFTAVFGILNLVMLEWRISVEERALRRLRSVDGVVD